MTWFIDVQKVIPYQVHKTVFDLDYEALKKRYSAVMFDLDNTLLPYDNSDITSDITALFESLKTLGYQVMLVSNSTSSRVKTTADALGVPYIKSAKKPLKKAFLKALKILNVSAPDTLFVGDQLMTDVYGANRAGLTPILVRAIKRKSERWYTRINRKIEQKMLKKMRHIAPKKAKEIQSL